MTCATVPFVLYYHWYNSSASRQLATFDADRAIPDHDNAALVYARLLEEHVNPFSLSDLAVIPGESALTEIRRDLGLDEISSLFEQYPQTRLRPWTETEFPATAKLLDKYARARAILQDAAQLESSYFLTAATKLNKNAYAPSYDPHEAILSWEPTYQHILLETIERYRDLLLSAAYLDMGEGRLSESIDTAWALMQISKHLCQFPLERCLYSGAKAELDGLHILNRMILAAPTDLLNLTKWQEATRGSHEHWLPALHQARAIGKLIYKEGQKRLGIDKQTKVRGESLAGEWWPHYTGTPLRHWELSSLSYIPGPRTQSPVLHRFEKVSSQYQRLHFLAKLRRFKERTGQWPTHFDQVRSSMPAGVLEVLQDREYPLIWFSPDCFVLYGLPSMSQQLGDHMDFTAHDLLVIDGSELLPCESDRVTQHVTYFVQRALEYPVYNYQLGEYVSRLAGYSMPLIMDGLRHVDPRARTTALHLLSFMGKESQAAIHDIPRRALLEVLLSGYKYELDETIQNNYLLSLRNLTGLPPEDNAFLVSSLRSIIANSQINRHRWLAANVLLEVSELDGLIAVLDQSDLFLESSWRSAGIYRSRVWALVCRVLGPFGLEEYIEEKIGYSRFDRPSSQSREALTEWWQENRETVISALESQRVGEHQIN